MAEDWHLGVDIGGTFTDLVLEGAGTSRTLKVLTTHDAPDDAIMAGLARLTGEAVIAPSDLTRIIHGTTLATNALIERRGAKTAFVTTEGFRDVLEMRTESRFEQYDLNLVLPDPLIPRKDRHIIAGRLLADGSELTPLDFDAVPALAERLKDYDSIAIGLLHAYANPAHEQALREALSKALPGIPISISSEVSPQMREYERFSTTCANAYIRPLMEAYLTRLAGRLAEAGAQCPVFLMHSGGGIMALDQAALFPVRLVESGPAGGAIFAADLARRHGLDRVLSFDMGGTTAKICLIRGGAPKTARVFEVARSYRFKKGSGMPISIPVIDMVEIGAGGGSLGSVDALGRIAVGPESAGSEPGPASYGRGGTRPAITDADLLLGKLDPDGFAGGEIRLHPDRAEAAMTAHIGAPLDLEAAEAARGMAEVVDETMANAARVHAVESGEDPADYTMIAFGGAAPLHAGRLCEKLGIDRLLVPKGAGVGSAIGFLRAPVSFEAARSRPERLDSFDAGAVADLLADLNREARTIVEACAPGAEVERLVTAQVRYVGQGWDIPVPLPGLSPNADEIAASFEETYRTLFSRVVENLPVEVTSWAVEVRTVQPDAPPVPEAKDGATVEVEAVRTFIDPASGAVTTAQVAARDQITDGAHLTGPAFLTESETTIVVPPGFTATGRADGTIDIRRTP